MLEGSVRRDSSNVRITAQLIQVKDQTHVWAREYDRELKDLLSVQAEIAQEVGDEITLTLSNRPAATAANRSPLTHAATSYEAYDLYLEGRYSWNQRTETGFKRAADYFQQAIAKDPAYGAAYSQLAKLYYSTGDMDKASEAISQALERDPYQPDFLYVQGKILEKQGKMDEALVVFQRTTIVNPKESDAFFEMGAIYEQRGDRTNALAAYKKAAALSPDEPDYQRALSNLSGAATQR